MQALFETGWRPTSMEIIRFCDEKDDGPSNKEAIVDATNRWYNGIQSAWLCFKVSDWEMEEQYNHTEHTTEIVFQLPEPWSDGNSWRLHQFSTGDRHDKEFFFCSVFLKVWWAKMCLFCDFLGENCRFSSNTKTIDILWLPNCNATIAAAVSKNRRASTVARNHFVRKVSMVWNTWSRCFLKIATLETTHFARMCVIKRMRTIWKYCNAIWIQMFTGIFFIYLCQMERKWIIFALLLGLVFGCSRYTNHR